MAKLEETVKKERCPKVKLENVFYVCKYEKACQFQIYIAKEPVGALYHAPKNGSRPGWGS
jgi:hypothetical protein